jgi:2-phosphosulfolactate phosphatase
MLPSPNGSRLSLAGGTTPVFAGCLRNAEAVARVVREMAGDGAVGVIPAGERWPDGSLRPAIEDLLGAGAILEALGMPLSSESRVARDAFRSAGSELASIIRESVSGRELRESGFPGDVEIALESGASLTAPILRNGAYQAV